MNNDNRLKLWICLALAAVTLAVYSQALRFQFLTFDDQAYVTENRHVLSGLSGANIAWAFHAVVAGNWHPVTMLSHMTDSQVYGLNPWGHHLTNILLHTANAVLLFLLLARMTGGIWPSACVAALFALHPTRVESVAWIAERKDVLCGFFCFLAIWAYLRRNESVARGSATVAARKAGISRIVPPVTLAGVPPGNPMTISSTPNGAESDTESVFGETPKTAVETTALPKAIESFRLWAQESSSKFRYATVTILFLLALMSKPMAVTLPFVLLLLDLWPLQRVKGLDWPAWRRLVIEKWFLLLLSFAWCGVTMWAQSKDKAVASEVELPFIGRLNHAMISYWVYMRLLIFPWHLSAYYPYQRHESLLLGLSAAVGLTLVTVISIMCMRRRPYVTVGWLWFLGMLVPVAGFVQVGGQAWADRYLYLPAIGFFIVAVWGLAEWTSRFPAIKLLIPAAAAILIAATSKELGYWKDTGTLFARAIEVTDNNYLAMTLKGSMEADTGNTDEAIALFRHALDCKPAYPEAHFFLGRALESKGQTNEAMTEFNQALKLRPDFDAAHVMVGLILTKEGKYGEAIPHYKAALNSNPDSAAALSDWGMALTKQGLWQESIGHYEEALRLDPTQAEAHNNLAIDYLQTGRLAEGIRELRQTLKLDPGNGEAKFNLGQALNQSEQWAEAAQILLPLAKENPSHFNAQFQCGLAEEHVGQTREAMSFYSKAISKNPNFPEALQHLAWIEATDARPELRNGAQAVEHAKRACELTGEKRPGALLTLSAAYAEAGEFKEALTTVEKASDLAKKQGQQGLEAQAQRLQKMFRDGQPFHGASK